jgi:hypothetical protein
MRVAGRGPTAVLTAVLTVALAAALVLVVGACARPGAVAGTSGSPGASASVSVPPGADQLRADGSVPWIDQRITDHDLNPPAAPPTVAPGARPCQAKQLTGTLTQWYKPGTAGETPHGFDAQIGKLYGWVDLHNTSKQGCTLQGEVPTTLLAAGTAVPMLYTHGISTEARQWVTAVPAGGGARLRLDWSGPFCGAAPAPLELAIELPHDGGTLRAPITPTDRPACSPEQVKPTVKGTLSSGGFEAAPASDTSAESPVAQLTATAQPPAGATIGRPFMFHIVLANPTGAPIALNPCPGYLIELFSRGDATHQPVNTSQLYRLNCWATATIAAHGTLSFEMSATVPTAMTADRELSITWRLVPGPATVFTIPVQSQ